MTGYSMPKSDTDETFSFFIKSLRFNDGLNLSLEAGCTLIFTGPNNCGKSVTLREIADHILRPELIPHSIILRSIETQHEATRSSFISWMRRNYPVQKTAELVNNVLHPDVETFLTAQGRGMTVSSIPEPLTLAFLTQSAKLLVQRLEASTRLSLADSAVSLPYDTGPAAYIHFLQRNEELRRSISALVQAAFDRELIINWGGGQRVWFHVGSDPARSHDEDRVSPRYLTDLAGQPRLDHEGDGIRSFVGLVLAAKFSSHPICVIDEPEAFLHPPQARRLGAILAESAATGKRQMIVATHSSDIIRGAMDASRNVVVCRMVREGSLNRVSVLGRSELQDLWMKPLLRSSVAIDGLFHSGVVVCEGDSDCRFYEAMALRTEKEPPRALDMYFAHGGGKGAIAALVQTYRALSVPTAVIADLDLLRRREEFLKLYETLGGDAEGISALYHRVSAALNDRKPLASVSDFANCVEVVLNRVKQTDRITPSDRRQIRDALETASDWSEAKRYGVNRLKGSELTAGKDLLARCQEIGLFMVPCGALEGWWAEGPTDKAAWIADTIPKISESPEVFRDAADFVASVCGYLAGRTALNPASI